MADQYQNFSNPTITPAQPTGWQSASLATSGAIDKVSNYVMSQQQKIQDLQAQQASDLSKLKSMDAYQFGGKYSGHLDSLLSQNPYGKHLVTPKSSSELSNAGGPTGNMNIAAYMIGAPGADMVGQGMYGQQPQPSAAGTVTPGNPATSGQNPGTPMSSVNPLSNGIVATEGSQSLKTPFGEMSKKVVNPAAEATVAGAKEFSSKMSGEMAGAQAGTAKDNQQLAMITNALKPLAESYDQVYNSKVGGVLPGAGDIYGSSVVKNADWLPRGIQGSIVHPETQKAAGQFLANKNELVTKLQPLLSQQFGKDGSSRIMESLLHMSQNELGDLNTPRAQFHGQLTGTISSLYRIAKAAQAYKQDLETSGATAPDEKTAAQEIFKRMQLQNMGPQENQELQKLIENTLGSSKAGSTGSLEGGSQNPVISSRPEAKQGNKALNRDVAQQLLQAAGGDKEKARQLARNQGYSF